MNQLIKKEKFVPDQELLLFAEQFEQSYKTVKPGDIYHSSDCNYTIKCISSGEMGDSNPCRVSRDTGEILIAIDSLTENKKYKPDFVYFIILWAICCYQVGTVLKEEYPFQKADLLTIEYYATTGRPKKPVFDGLLLICDLRPNDYNFKRCQASVDYLVEVSKKKKKKSVKV